MGPGLSMQVVETGTVKMAAMPFVDLCQAQVSSPVGACLAVMAIPQLQIALHPIASTKVDL